MTFPRSEQDLPHPTIPPLAKQDRGAGSGAVNDRARPASNYSITYDKGAKVGYKWYESESKQPLFPFGYGLSYTTYAYSNLKVDSAAKTVTFTVKNTGQRAGDEIAQVYATLPAASEETYKRLAGFERVTLAPGESKTITITLNPQVLSIFDEQKEAFQLLPGAYKIVAGPSSADTPLQGSITLQ
jgi:beta-glucosidase